MDPNPDSPAFHVSLVDGVDEDVVLELEVLNELTRFLSRLFDKDHVPEARREQVLRKYWRRMQHLDHQLKQP